MEMCPVETHFLLKSTSITGKEVIEPQGTFTHCVEMVKIKKSTEQVRYSFDITIKLSFYDIKQEYGEITGVCKQIFDKRPDLEVLKKYFDIGTDNALQIIESEASGHLDMECFCYLPLKSEKVSFLVRRALEKMEQDRK